MRGIAISSDPPPGAPEPAFKTYALNLVVLRVEDLEAALRFYVALGLRFSRSRYGSRGLPCAHSHVSGPEIALTSDDPAAMRAGVSLELHPRADRSPTTGTIIGFFVSSVDEAVAGGLSAGGRLLTPAADWPWGRRAAVADPDGHRVELGETPWGRLTGDYPMMAEEAR